MIVAFCACPWKLAAPGCWVCAPATAIDPSTNKAAAKVTVIFRIRSILLSGGDERQSMAATLQQRDNVRILHDSATGGDAFTLARHLFVRIKRSLGSHRRDHLS
jgi:hypothetical protein